MKEKELIDAVCNVLAEALHLNGVQKDAAFGEIKQWDSMGHMDVMMMLEDKFGVEINADTISNLINVQSIVGYIEGIGNERE